MINIFSSSELRQYLKNSNNKYALALFNVIKMIRVCDLPAPKVIYTPVRISYKFLNNAISSFLRVFFWTPIFKTQLIKSGQQLYLYGGLPYISGSINITVGDQCRISGCTTFSGRTCSATLPEFILGNNIDVGWMTTIAVGRKVVLHDNVRIAGQCLLAGYPGHPLEANARAMGLPELDTQVGDIILEKDVWLATGVYVMAGVTIGEGTVVAAGSIVTKSLPSHVLAAGVPARVIKQLENNDPLPISKHDKGVDHAA